MATGIIEVVIAELAAAVVGKLGEVAIEQVANQASLLLHFRKDFEWLQKQLTKVKGFLQYEHDQDEPVKKWFADVKDIALDAEDMVQECAVQPLYGGDTLVFRFKMGRRIRKLKERMESIMQDLADLNLVQEACQDRQLLTSFAGAEDWKKSGLIERDAKPVAIDAKVEQILLFIEDHALQIIAVVGMGGIGKTFLLQNVYNHPSVRQRFEKAIWLSISQVYSVERLQKDIASHFNKDVKEGGLREQRVAELMKKVGVREHRVFKLIKEGGLSEQQAADLIKEVGVRKQRLQVLKKRGLSEQEAEELIHDRIQRIMDNGITKKQAQELIMIRKVGVRKQRMAELIIKDDLSEEVVGEFTQLIAEAVEFFQMLRDECSLIEWIKEGAETDQHTEKLIKEGGLSEQQAADLIQMLRDESSLIEWIKEGGVTRQQAAELIRGGVLSKQQAQELIQRLENENSLIESIKNGGVTEQRAAELIQKRLKYESCLIVLDDVWRVKGVNNLMERLGIPDGSNPFKLVVTTRSMEVCNIMGASQIYRMELMSEEDSWNLFCLHAFSDDPHNRPPQELDEVAQQVERECCRLPLAIKTIAASMVREKQFSSWESKLRQLKEVSCLEDPIEPILRLSYNALPPQLKLCFLYFSFFGEDVEIDAEYLIYLWIGEGFILQGKEQLTTGWLYLKQLNDLCLVEVREDEELRRTCKIHDLLLDLIISISKENKCAFRVEEISDVGCRRILLAKKCLDDSGISELKCPKSLRTLSLSHNNISELPTESLTSVGALRVIDLSYNHISLLPRCMGNFKLLRVLNLSNSGFKYSRVPDCVRNLKSLCFLNASECYSPRWIGDLKCLQHLHVRSFDHEGGISISKLASLRTLRTVYQCKLVLKDVAKLIHLEELRIDITNEAEQRGLEEGVLAQLVNMRRLTVVSQVRYGNFPHFPEKMKAMKDLRVLKLNCCELSQCPALATMPNLMKLDLYQCGGRRLPESYGKSGAFPQLRSLLINKCSWLRKLPDLEHGSMPRVELFTVINCPNLQKIPEGFEHLRSLKLLDLTNNNNLTYEERLKEGGEYWNKIKANNPDIRIEI